MKGSRPEQAVLSRNTDLSWTEETRAVIEGMVDGLNDHRIDDIDQFFAHGFRWMGNQGCGTKNGLKEFQENWQRPFQAAFSDKSCIDEARLFMGEWAAAFGRQEATHSGSFMGIAPTGKQVEIRYMDFWKVEKGKISDNWVMVDFPHVMAQLGVDVFNGEGWEAFDRGERVPPSPETVTISGPKSAPDFAPGWEASAPGWLAQIGEHGDATRMYVMDAPVLEALPLQGTVADIGCGEGRFCRIMQSRGMTTIGIEPTPSLCAAATERDSKGNYIGASAEALPLDSGSCDVALFYLSLIDIADYRGAIAEAVRILRPGGRLIAVNLTETVTARPRNWTGEGSHWVNINGERQYMAVDDIQTERPVTTGWGDIRIINHHRPLSAYMKAFLDNGLILRSYDIPPYTGPESETKDKFDRMPWANLMVWDKPEE